MEIMYTVHAEEQVKERKIEKIYTMKIRYDPDADAMYIMFREGKIDHTKEVDRNTVIDYDKNGEIIGIEVLFVKERNPHLLKEFQVENLMAV